MDDTDRGGVSAPMALAFATIGFFALVIAGFGLTSLFLDAEVVSVGGVAPLGGILAVALACLAFALVLWAAVRRTRPLYRAAVFVALVTYLAALLGLLLGALFGGGDIALALAATGRFAVSWFGAELALAAAVAAWCGIALARTRARRPRWPWENPDEG